MKVAAQRVEELLRMTLPLGIEVQFQFGFSGVPSAQQTHLFVDHRNYPCGADVRDDAVAIGIVNEFLTTAKREGVSVESGQLAFCNSISAANPTEAFRLALAYLRERNISEMTLAPVERIIHDALTSAEVPSLSEPVSTPQR